MAYIGVVGIAVIKENMANSSYLRAVFNLNFKTKQIEKSAWKKIQYIEPVWHDPCLHIWSIQACNYTTDSYFGWT